MIMHPGLTNSGLYQGYSEKSYLIIKFFSNVNNSISPKVTALHPADLESEDSGAIETTIKHCMDAKARYTPLGPRL